MFILAVPILTKDGDLLGVLELGRKDKEPRFSEEDEEIAKSYLSWATVVLDYTNIFFENMQSKLIFDSFGRITRLVLKFNWLKITLLLVQACCGR